MGKARHKLKAVPELLKLDLGCGTRKKEGFSGVDAQHFEGVDLVVDLRKTPWPWADNSVAEVHCSHFLEHLTGAERIGFFNELYRVLVPGGKCQIIVPHWASGRAYGDPTHQWPPVVEFSFFYLSKDWRKTNAPHVGFTCDFDVSWGHGLAHPWQLKTQEQQQFGLTHYREVATDIIATATKK